MNKSYCICSKDKNTYAYNAGLYSLRMVDVKRVNDAIIKRWWVKLVVGKKLCRTGKRYAD